MRRQHSFSCVLQPQPLAHVFEAAADGQRGGSEHCALEFVEEASLQDGCHIDGSGLKENPGLVAVAASPFDPEHRVAVLGFHQKAKLYLQLLRAPRSEEHTSELQSQ